MLGQENIATYVPEIKLRSNSIYIKHKPSKTYPDQLRIGPSMTIKTRTNQARSLRKNRTCTLSGHYVVTELEPSSVATLRPSVRPARSLRSNRALPKRRYDISPCILVYPSMLSPEDRSEPISCFPPF
ncbi:hypothetical protein F2Q70_00002231 [Brassica cretica]|uniref:Uncharacterized protein n=1 Tax=Brassica cretica TaxID=69181 RepID=A0A8S9IMM2_BRACR|nr:hypothetical protein F2Q70_00002231 [Brassica cretica]